VQAGIPRATTIKDTAPGADIDVTLSQLRLPKRHRPPPAAATKTRKEPSP
jgi:hypothetical protein